MATSTLQTNMQSRLAAYIDRTVAELTVNALTLGLDAMNMAKLDGQRRHNFKMNRSPGWITTQLTGAQMSTITSDQAGTTPLATKYIEAMWTWASNGTTVYRWNRVPAMTLGDQKLLYSTTTTQDYLYPVALPPNTVNYLSQDLRWFQQGTLVCVNGVFQPQQFWVDVIQFLPAYDGTTATDDFFLTYYWDWLFMASLDYLNLFLKEDQRIPISATKMERLFNTVCANDEQFSEGAFDIDENN